MNAEQLIENIQAAGGILVLKGERIQCELPADAAPLLDELRTNRDEVFRLLQRREAIPEMPPGVTLLRWAPAEPPVIITRWAVVTDVHKFVRCTLGELAAALQGKRWLAGHWTVRELVDRLEQCGVVVKVLPKSCTS